MKHFLTFCLILSFALFYSCKETAPAAPSMPEEKTPSKLYAVSYKDTIHNSTFNAWTSRWQSNQKAWMAAINNSINYFGMPLSDLSSVLETRGAVSSRFYLGLTTQDSIHLVVVGVDAQGNNMLDNSKDQFAYDVSLPCPTACGDIAQ